MHAEHSIPMCWMSERLSGTWLWALKCLAHLKLTCCALAQNTSSKWVANPSLSHSSVQSRAPIARPNQAWAISWQRRVPQSWLIPVKVLWERKTMCGLWIMGEKTHKSLVRACPHDCPPGAAFSALPACYYHVHARSRPIGSQLRCF